MARMAWARSAGEGARCATVKMSKVASHTWLLAWNESMTRVQNRSNRSSVVAPASPAVVRRRGSAAGLDDGEGGGGHRHRVLLDRDPRAGRREHPDAALP